MEGGLGVCCSAIDPVREPCHHKSVISTTPRCYLCQWVSGSRSDRQSQLQLWPFLAWPGPGLLMTGTTMVGKACLNVGRCSLFRSEPRAAAADRSRMHPFIQRLIYIMGVRPDVRGGCQLQGRLD